MATITHTFTPPTKWEGPAGTDGLFYRYRLERGLSVLKMGGSYYLTTFPTQDEVSASDAVYMGGYTHRVDATEAAALTAAGYGSYLSPILSGYGLNGFGEGPYGGVNAGTSSSTATTYGDSAYGDGTYGG